MQTPLVGDNQDFLSSSHHEDDQEFFSKDFLKSLNVMRQTQQFIDVIITAQNEIFAAHKLILAIHSPYFCQLFQANSGLSNVSLETPSFGVRLLLDYFYTGQIKINQANLNAITKAANLLKIQKVLNICQDFESNILSGVQNELAKVPPVIQDNEPTTSMNLDDENVSYNDDNDSNASSENFKVTRSVFDGLDSRKRYLASSSSTKPKLMRLEQITNSIEIESQNMLKHSDNESKQRDVDYNDYIKTCFAVPQITSVASFASSDSNKVEETLYNIERKNIVIEPSSGLLSNSLPSAKNSSKPSENCRDTSDEPSDSGSVSLSKENFTDKNVDVSIEIKSEPNSPEPETTFETVDFENDLLPNYSVSERSSSVASQNSQNHSIVSSGEYVNFKHNEIFSQSLIPVDVEIREDQITYDTTGCFDFFNMENVSSYEHLKSKTKDNISLSTTGPNLIINNVPVAVVLSSRPKAYICGICGQNIIGLHSMANHIQTIHKSLKPNSLTSFGEDISCGKVKIDVTNILSNSRPRTESRASKTIPSGASISCETCGLVFDYLWDLFKHQDLIHKVKSVLSCDLCPYIGNNERNLHFHRYSVHGVSLPLEWEKKAQKCPYCPHIARAPSMLKTHISRKHLDERNNTISQMSTGEYTCHLCEARFIYAQSLKKHLTTHTDDMASD